MKAFIKRIIIVNLLLAGFILGYGYFCDWFFAAPQFLDHQDNKRAWCIKKKNEQYDLAVLGSSRAFGSFDMNMLAELTGKKVINLGANGSGYVDNYLVLHQFLKNNNTIKQLALQVDIYSLNAKQSFSNHFHTFQFLPYWSDPVIKKGILPYLDQKEKITWKYFPALRYFTYNKYFSPKEVIRRYRQKNKTKSPFDKSLGGPGKADRQFEPMATELTSQTRSLDTLDIEYLNKIIALCQQNNIKVVAYKAPELLSRQQQIKNYKELNEQVTKILTDAGIHYLQPDTLLEANETNFANPTHLNKNGMMAFTQSFSAQVE